jgi:hypothetical protein
LLIVVLAVPLDVELGAAELDDAAQTFAEHCLGDRALDRWVASIDVVRLPRRGSLALIQEFASATAETYPLQHLEPLMQTGIDAILAEQPSSRLGPGGAEWVALEMSPTDQGVQADRSQAFTSCPEALKAALEGLPFDSGRFTRGSEVFAWLRWSSREGNARATTKLGAEHALERALQRGLPVQLTGTGFGRRTDYVDIWVDPTATTIRQVLALTHEAVRAPVDLGFYDTVWAAEVLRVD